MLSYLHPTKGALPTKKVGMEFEVSGVHL